MEKNYLIVEYSGQDGCDTQVFKKVETLEEAEVVFSGVLEEEEWACDPFTPDSYAIIEDTKDGNYKWIKGGKPNYTWLK